MNPEQENFDSLRLLVKIKRYEQPPPRYFKDFSSQVIARIEREQIAPASASWLDKFADLFYARPALSGVMGAAVCLLLVGTAVYSENGGPQAGSTEYPFKNPGGVMMADLEDASTSTNSGSLFRQIKLHTQAAIPAAYQFSLPSQGQ